MQQFNPDLVKEIQGGAEAVSEMAEVRKQLGIKDEEKPADTIAEMQKTIREHTLTDELRDRVKVPQARPIIRQMVLGEMKADEAVVDTIERVLKTADAKAITSRSVRPNAACSPPPRPASPTPGRRSPRPARRVPRAAHAGLTAGTVHRLGLPTPSSPTGSCCGSRSRLTTTGTQTNAELKSAGLARLSSGRFMANAAWLALTAAPVSGGDGCPVVDRMALLSTFMRGHDAVPVEERPPVGCGTYDRPC
jgi:hypothetical protein